MNRRDKMNSAIFKVSGATRLGYTQNMIATTCGPRAKKFLLFLLVLSLITVGCGSYTSQAEQNLTKASSDIASAAYVLEQFGNGEVSGPYNRTSLQEYAKSMQKTEKSLQNLNPPPPDEERHERAVDALSQAQNLVQEAGQEGVSREEAPGLARRLKGFGEELKT